MAYAEGMMVSPRVLRQHVFPYLKEMGHIASNHDLFLTQLCAVRAGVDQAVRIFQCVIQSQDMAIWGFLGIAKRRLRRNDV